MSATALAMLEDQVRRYPDRDAVQDYNTHLQKNSLTFQRFWTLSARCAALLRQQGLKRGDYVIINVPLGLEYWVTSFGAMLAGGASVPSKKVTQDGRSMIEGVRLSGAGIMFLKPDESSDTWKLFKPHIPASAEANRDLVTTVAHPDMPKLKTTFLVRRTTDGQKGFLDILDSLTEEFVDRGVGPSDAALVSVTMNMERTWAPKLVEISHRALAHMAVRWQNKFPDWDTMYFPYPWYSGQGIPIDTIAGRTRQQCDCWDIEIEYLDIQTRLFRNGIVKNVSTASSDLLYAYEFTQDVPGPVLENAIVGGGQITHQAMERFQKVSKNVIATYLMSEITYVTLQLIDRSQPFKDFYAGRVEDGIQLKIIDEDHQEVAPGKPGIIALKSESLFTQYVGEPELNKKAWTKDGWFITCDGGFVSPDDGHLFCFGRQGDVIVRDIVLIPAKVLEQPISEHPDILEVKVVPVPDPLNGQNTCACVVKRPGSQLTLEELQVHAASVMTAFGGYLYALDYLVTFETSITGKPKRELINAACKHLGINPRD